MDLHKINSLIKKYVDGTATEAERQELNRWYRDTASQDAEFPGDEDEVYNSMLQHLDKATAPRRVFMGKRLRAAAASVLLLMGAGAVWFYVSKTDTPVKMAANVIVPGSDKAILTLANGKKISLTDAGNGQIASQNGIHISKTDKGQVVYSIDASAGAGSAEYNTIETPAGGQFKVLLPDGTRIWLNARSSIKFPVNFASAKQRVVQLKGEAYFDVKHNVSQPFRVLSAGQVVEDIGTQFNIQAYDDEKAIETTLIEGAARVMAGKGNILLKPGEQTVYNQTLTVMQANLDKVTAWKNGYFIFEDDKLEDIMKVISRWYNITYVFEDQSLRNEVYGAVTARYSNINTLLDFMKATGGAADFKIEGTTITIVRRKG